MKRILCSIILILFLFSVYAQTFSGKVAGHNKGEMNVVLTMFGFEKLVKKTIKTCQGGREETIYCHYR